MRREPFLIACMAALIVLLALAPVGYAVYRYWPPRIATVDMHTLVEENQQQVVRQLRQEHATTDEARTMAARQTAEFAKRLSHALDALGQACHCVILHQAALLAGTAPDYTDWVRERVKP